MGLRSDVAAAALDVLFENEIHSRKVGGDDLQLFLAGQGVLGPKIIAHRATDLGQQIVAERAALAFDVMDDAENIAQLCLVVAGLVFCGFKRLFRFLDIGRDPFQETVGKRRDRRFRILYGIGTGL